MPIPMCVRSLIYPRLPRTDAENGMQFVTVKSARTALGYDRQGRLMIVQVEGRTWERGVDL